MKAIFIALSFIWIFQFAEGVNAYIMLDSTALYADAEQACLDTYGTSLASLHSLDDYELVQSMCDEKGSTKLCWLGGQETASCVWEWNDLTAWDYTGIQWEGNQGCDYPNQPYMCLKPNALAVHDCHGNEEYYYPICNDPCADIAGGDWYLVRHTYDQWHPAEDNLEGTEEYGLYDADPRSVNSWSIPFSQYLKSDGSTLFMFSNGDCSKWLVTTNDQFTTTHDGLYNADIESSYRSTAPYQATWFNRHDRAVYDEDPWISAQNHATDLLYGEARNEYHSDQILGQSLNVWIRKSTNECMAETDNCNANAVCLDTADGFDCACKTGYSGDGVSSCADICETSPCDTNAVCAQNVATLPGYDCACNGGYTGDGQTCCEDAVYGFDTATATCVDINECTLGTDNCDDAATCINNEGGFTCECPSGYSGDGVTCASDDQKLELSASNCNDFYQLEPLTLSSGNIVGSCTIGAEVEVEFDVNIKSLPGGSYYSLFHIGNADVERMPGVWIRGGNNAWTVHNTININTWIPDGNNPDIDLTNPRPFVGIQHFYMKVTETHYYLSITGMDFTYSGDFDRSNYFGQVKNIYFSNPWYPTLSAVVTNVCIRCGESDIDECSQGTDDCDENALCTNTVGSYVCECVDGYEGSGDVCCAVDSGYTYDAAANACVNVDECADGSNECDDNASCTDTEGSYECECNPGYTGDGFGCSAICNMETQRFVWEDLLETAAGKPYQDTTLSITGVTLNIRTELSYLGASEADKDGFVYGTTYVIDFEDFNAHKDSIREPGTCQNRVASDFTESAASWDTLWDYSDSPHVSGNLGTTSDLAYPPPGVWSIDMATNDECRVVYTTSLTWDELTDCVGSDGSSFITAVDSDTDITLSGTLYINVVSPFSYKNTDFGFYRVYQLLSQPFQIVVSKTVYVLGSVGINLLNMDVIAVYKEDDESTFRLILLTESAEYLRLSRDAADITETSYLQTFIPDDEDNIVTWSSFTTLKAAETGTDCLGSKAYICEQLWEIRAENVQCSESTGAYTDFSGKYSIQFDPVCRSGEYKDYCDEWLEDHTDEIVDATGKVLLTAELEWRDMICDPRVFEVQFTASMEFFYDGYTNSAASNYLYQVGESTVYVKVTTEYPDSALDVFETELLSVWICTFDPLDPPEPLDPAIREGGCFSEKTDDNSERFEAHIYDLNEPRALYDFAVDADASNSLESREVQFEFTVPKTVERDTLYIHAQIEVSLAANRRRMIVDAFMKKETNQMEHFVDRIGVSASPHNEPEPVPRNHPHKDVNYEPKAAPETPVQTPFAVLQSRWVIAIGCLLALVLTVNLCWMCYMKFVKGGGAVVLFSSRRSYAAVKSADSEFYSASASENDALNDVASE